MVWFQLLGHVSARSEGGEVPLGSARQRAVLAALLVEPGTHVSLDQLVDRVWGTTPPRSARQTLHSYVSRLRSVLDDHDGPLLERRSGGYVLEADDSTVDLQRFRTLVAQARRADGDAAGALWQEAMGLWRGRPFADLDSDWLRSTAVRLEAEHLAAVLDHNDLLLSSGQHARLLPGVTAAAETHPLDERLAGQVMLALYRCGRQSDALAHYRLLQERLADELGSDPGPELRELHQRILRHDAEQAAPDGAPNTDRSAPSPASPSRPAADVAADKLARPAQLPLDVTGFTGRSGDLRRLDELLVPGADDGRAGRTVVITAIRGTAGVGKTALAVHWAHQVADDFPDGQLYVNLRGYDPEQPMRPADALARFLAALGVPERDIPLDDDERAARYRSELADRRMLIVLDNAGSVAQVRPLLPGSGASTVVVTSRDSLAGLVAVHGAHRIDLDLLPTADAAGLLRRLIGERVDADPVAAELLAEQCARLPLALRVAAVLATSQPDRPLADVVAELADRQERLELLDPGGDPYAAVQAVFSWSIQHLPEQAARMFRRLGLHPGPDVDPYGAAALTGTDVAPARRALELLVSAHLLHRADHGRYGMHDLLRAYAARLAATEDTGDDRDTAEDRLFTYYQASVFAAVDTLYPASVHYRPDATELLTPTPDLAVPSRARDWLQAERSCLLAIVEHPAAHQRSGYVVGLARLLHRYLSSSHTVDLIAINTHALRVAERAGDLNGQAHVLRQLGVGYVRVSRYELAVEHYNRSLALFRQTGDTMGEALTRIYRGNVDYQRGDPTTALEGHNRAIALARQAGDRFIEAVALTNLAAVEGRLGHDATSYDACQQALVIFRDLGTLYDEAVALHNLANVEMSRGQHVAAIEHLRRSLTVAETLDIAVMKATVLDTLGMLHLRLEEPDQATECFRRALTHSREIGDRSSQVWSINGLGEAAQLAGSSASALRFHTEALGIATDVGLRHQQARAHAGIGHAHRGLGDPDQARSHYENAYVIYTDLDMPDAAEMFELMGDVPAA
ncbi:AfsR/SARP family transcriptional regulator [Promicromonospora soli]|uniref:XRE family transcriptional regulator n=1 Tax=Promicromonospora soli TaxID=2035533 RepID=A0A919G225_9MICO|nr:tetratricopeptide repeat protein [Promicromonospora soli]GHH76446.1 XRE family transcriptional regulator [Promicromonospora soli]